MSGESFGFMNSFMRPITFYPSRFAPRAGFSLLEISIVLAITALLAGAIVGMQSYTRSTALITSVEEARYYVDAFDQFQTLYGAAPGDMSTASSNWTSASNGDGNGLIRAVSNNNAELFYAFNHLYYAQLITGYYSGAAGSGGSSHAIIGQNIPSSAVDNVGYLFNHPNDAAGVVAAGDSVYFEGTYSHVLILAGMITGDTSTPSRVYMTTKEAYELDAKYDDGNPGQGWVLTPEMSTLANCATSDTPASAAYNVTYNEKACYFIFKIS